MTEARIESRTVGSLVRQRMGYGADAWDLALVQRDRVWDHRRIRRLLDSLLAGYPIGSLLVCSVPQAADGMDPQTRAVTHIDAGADQLLDGQQRIAAMASLLGATGEPYRFFLDMTAIRRRATLAVDKKAKDHLVDYINWRQDDQELVFRPIAHRERYLQLSGFAEWAGLTDADDPTVQKALGQLAPVLDDPAAPEDVLREAIAFLADIDPEFEAQVGAEDLLRTAEQAERLLRAWLRPVPVERHVFADKLDILEAFERVNLEGVKVVGDDVFFAAVKTAWPGADRALANVVTRVPVINRLGALRLFARLAALAAGQGDLLPLRVERLNGPPGEQLVANISGLTAADGKSLARMATVSRRLIAHGGPGQALRHVPSQLWDDVLAWAASNPVLDDPAAMTDEAAATVASYLIGATAHDWWPIFGEWFATRSFRFAVTAGIAGQPFPLDAIAAKVKEGRPDLRQGRRTVPTTDELAGRHEHLFLCMVQEIPFALPLRQPVDPAYPTARVQVEWDHIWPQAKSGTMRLGRKPTEGSRSVYRVGNLWALDRPLNTSASDAWPTDKLAFLADPRAARPTMPHRWPDAGASFLSPDEEALLRQAEAFVRGMDGITRDVAAGAEVFASLVAARNRRITQAVLERFPLVTTFGVRAPLGEDGEPVALAPTPKPSPVDVTAALGLETPDKVSASRMETPAWGTQQLAHEMGLGEEFEILLAAINAAGLRVVDYHRDGVAKWAKVGLADPGKQARGLFWIVPEGGVPALALPHELPAFRDLLGIAPEVTRRHFGAERPLVRQGAAEEYVAKSLGPLLALARSGG